MDLTEAFLKLAEHCPVDVKQLLVFAQEDQHGGSDTGEFPREVSITHDEGMFLYALTRWLQPTTILEVGCADGGSALHLLQAIHVNQMGELVSIDISQNVGRLITEDLMPHWSLLVGDAQTSWLPAADLVFEDSDHRYEPTKTVLLRLKALNPKIIISHDYCRHLFDPAVGVKAAFDEVFPDGFSIWFDNTRTGLGVWVNLEMM